MKDMCLQSILNLFNPPKYPKKLGDIWGDDLYHIFRDNFGDKVSIWQSDSKFDLTSVDQAKLYTTGNLQPQYTAEGHDCDNFSFALMGYWSAGLESFAFGIAWSSMHAFNIMLDDQKKLWIVEPQTNNFIAVDEAKKDPKYYPLTLILV
jgi:hypothetical protein